MAVRTRIRFDVAKNIASAIVAIFIEGRCYIHRKPMLLMVFLAVLDDYTLIRGINPLA
jgi:hypothetical protein